MAGEDRTVRLDLHGAKAVRGVDIDALQGFLQYFRAALRDYDRATSHRREEVGRGGHPDARSKAVTNLRLTRFRVGSGIATLEEPPALETGLPLDIEGTAIWNLKSLLDSIERGDLDRPVIDLLDEARRQLGPDGRYVIAPVNHSPVELNLDTIRWLERAAAESDDPVHTTVSGRLHLVEVEEPFRVEIRASDGTNWACAYPPELEDKVLSLVKSIVWARGIGRRKGKRGTMELQDIEGVPEYEQSELFTREHLSTEELERAQGIRAPQGLNAVQDAGWRDDEADRMFLTSLLED